jgi:hypothetical protein
MCIILCDYSFFSYKKYTVDEIKQLKKQTKLMRKKRYYKSKLEPKRLIRFYCSIKYLCVLFYACKCINAYSTAMYLHLTTLNRLNRKFDTFDTFDTFFI